MNGAVHRFARRTGHVRHGEPTDGTADNRVRFGHPIIDLARESLVDPNNGDRHQRSLAQRPCPAMIRNSSSIRIGFMKPNRSIRLICRLKCLRALRGHGFSASVESHSTWGQGDRIFASAGLPFDPPVHAGWLFPSSLLDPSLEFPVPSEKYPVFPVILQKIPCSGA
jgi:hypothetical protein